MTTLEEDHAAIVESLDDLRAEWDSAKAIAESAHVAERAAAEAFGAADVRMRELGEQIIAKNAADAEPVAAHPTNEVP